MRHNGVPTQCRASPLVTRPSHELRYDGEDEPQIAPQCAPSGGETRGGELSPELGESLLRLIYARAGSVTEKKRRAAPRKDEFIYVPPSLSSPKLGSAGQWWDALTDKLGVTTQRNAARVDLEALRVAGVTVADLLDDGISPTDLKQAGLLCNMADLATLHFDVADLVRDRTLFNASQCNMLFGCTHATMRAHGVSFNLEHLVLSPPARFLCSELETLQFSFDALIEDGGIGRSQLKELGRQFSFDELLKLGLTARGVRALDIPPQMALAAQPQGFGWPRDYAGRL